MSRVVHFDIQADDPARAQNFYSGVFGWKFEKWSGPMEYYLITTGLDKEPGINGGLAKRDKPAAAESITAYVCTISVPSVDDYTEKITKAGGKLVMAKTPVPRVGWHAQFKDTEGNLFGIMEDDPSAG